MTYRLATVHEFSVSVVIDVLNVNEAWLALAWWQYQSNNALWKGTIVNSAFRGALRHCVVDEKVTMAY